VATVFFLHTLRISELQLTTRNCATRHPAHIHTRTGRTHIHDDDSMRARGRVQLRGPPRRPRAHRPLTRLPLPPLALVSARPLPPSPLSAQPAHRPPSRDHRRRAGVETAAAAAAAALVVLRGLARGPGEEEEHLLLVLLLLALVLLAPSSSPSPSWPPAVTHRVGGGSRNVVGGDGRVCAAHRKDH